MDPREYEQKLIQNLKARTGKTLDEWAALVREQIPAQQKGRLKWIKETFGLGQSTAYLILHNLEHESPIWGENQDLVAAQFQGANAPLKPVYDWLSAQIQALGADVLVRPCKGYVPFYRSKQFAFAKAHKGQLHVGLALPEGVTHPRLEPVPKSMGTNERLKQKFTITSQEEVTPDLLDLIRLAYEQN
jgi:predicted transport protein